MISILVLQFHYLLYIYHQCILRDIITSINSNYLELKQLKNYNNSLFPFFLVIISFILLLGLCLIYAAIINLPIGLLMASLVGPFLLTVRPIFRISNIYTHYFFLDSFNIYNILSYLINIGFMIYIYYFVEFVGIDKIKGYLFNIIND